MIQESINLLGLKAKDKVTGMEGVISSISFDLFGCVQAVITPPSGANGKLEDSRYFDIHRLEIGTERVMDIPHFQAMARKPAEYNHGAADKPSRAY